MRATTIVSTLAFASVTMAATSPLIPSGISAGCSSFLTTLNTDTDLATCTSNLIKATKAFAPGSSANTSSSALTSTLTDLCTSTASGCSQSHIRDLLTGFASSCADELTGGNKNDIVKTLYDITYMFVPLKGAVCATDSATSKFCVQGLGGQSSNLNNTSINGTSTPKVNLALDLGVSISAFLKSFLSVTVTGGSVKRADSSAQLINSTTWHDTALPYLFLLPSSSAAELCTPCGKSILSAYVSWEVNLPYALGLANSPVLSGQLDLWNSVSTKCGQDFMNAITQGGTGTAPLGALSGAGAATGSALIASLVGAVTLALAL